MLHRIMAVLLAGAALVRAENLEQAVDGYILAAEAAGKPWEVTGTFGLTITDGNSDTVTVTAGIDAVKEWNKLKLTLAQRSIYAEDNNVQSANEHILTEKLEYALSERSWLTQNLHLEHDDEESLKYRVIFTLGYKRRLVKKDDFELFGEVGGGVQHDEFRTFDTTEGVALIGVSLKWQITDSLVLTHATTVYPSLSEGGEFFLVSETRLATPISERMDLSIVIYDTYDSDAMAPTKKNDLKVVVALTFKFTHPKK